MDTEGGGNLAGVGVVDVVNYTEKYEVIYVFKTYFNKEKYFFLNILFQQRC